MGFNADNLDMTGIHGEKKQNKRRIFFCIRPTSDNATEKTLINSANYVISSADYVINSTDYVINTAD